MDQSPFHRDEAGNVSHNTVVMRNAFQVPLLENHSHTRERWSLSTVTDSNKERIEKSLPGFEIMFKATGSVKENKLQKYADSL